MIGWLNPWGWLGLFTLLLPIGIHLLARRPPRRQRFPALRFLELTRLTPARRTRLSDIPLLLLRLLVLMLAVVALAGPTLSGLGGAQTTRARARVILVDTSASMQRAATAGGSGLESARAVAQRLAAEVPTTLIIETARPASQLAAAGEWLRSRPGLREIDLVSDFQHGTVSEHGVLTLPAGVGFETHAVALAADSIDLLQWQNARHTVTTRTTLEDGGTRFDWQARAREGTAAGIAVLSGASSSDAATATLEAARDIASQAAAARPVVFVFPDYENVDDLERTVRPLDEPWMGDIAATIMQDTVVRHAGASAAGELVLFSRAQAGTLDAARALARVLDAQTVFDPIELDPRILPPAFLENLQRTPQVMPAPEGGSIARWLWAIALLLLLIEGRVRDRRAREEIGASEEPLARVA